MSIEPLAPNWTAVLLPDGTWYAVDEDSIGAWTDMSPGGYRFLSGGVEYLVPRTSVLAIRL